GEAAFARDVPEAASLEDGGAGDRALVGREGVLMHDEPGEDGVGDARDEACEAAADAARRAPGEACDVGDGASIGEDGVDEEAVVRGEVGGEGDEALGGVAAGARGEGAAVGGGGSGAWVG